MMRGRLSADALRSRYSDLGIDVEADSAEFGELRVEVDSANALVLLRGLREDDTSPLARLSDLTAIDRGDRPGRFEVVYRLDSVDRNSPVRIHVRVDGAEDESDEGDSQPAPIVDSVIGLWPVAAWLEREVFDLFGIRFRGHPELRRLLLDSQFEGAPLRKDFPRTGDEFVPSTLVTPFDSEVASAPTVSTEEVE